MGLAARAGDDGAAALTVAGPTAAAVALAAPAARCWDAQQAPRCAAGCGASIDGHNPVNGDARRFCSTSCQKRTAQTAARQLATAARVWPCAQCGSEIRGGRRNRRFCGDACRWAFKNARKARPAATDSGDWLARFHAAAARWDAAHGRTHPWA